MSYQECLWYSYTLLYLTVLSKKKQLLTGALVNIFSEKCRKSPRKTPAMEAFS